ncbi:hypothetical protein QGN23_03700 [Chryseobacterium gotjawalense]|uniref:Uncharacterized protein n=1 Tax=Chryseobacterium gotjawalense TaxID=3042315 RepID=A0ABY8REM4_9FLAO|nr:hypothetical protein [Chryseobacterium sp. wdc7]WHF52390.1 hypothetical protein QGN23_03700 [Chryseobacterium sp. wdc7]
MKRKYPLVPSKDEDMQKVIWEELRIITLFLANNETNTEKNMQAISTIENRMVSTYDFENGINKICEILKQIEKNTSRQ